MGLFTNEHNARVCIVICTPLAKVTGPTGALIYDPISPLWHRARAGLHMPTNINICESAADGMEVGDARSRVAANCLAMKPRPEFLLFIDSDVIVPYDAFTKLFFRARCFPDHDIFAGVYCLKNDSVPDPLIYRENGQGAYWDWAVGDILTTDRHGIGAVHMGLTLIRVSLFARLVAAGHVHGDGTDQADHPFFYTGNIRTEVEGRARLAVGTEDIFFCDLAVRQLGAKILVDTSVLGGHHNKQTGVSYGLPWEENSPARRAKWLPGPDGKRQDRAAAGDYPCECLATPTVGLDGRTTAGCAGAVPRGGCPDCSGTGRRPFKLALDIGAGGTRREWPGYRTYTTDIRPGVGVDYVQDTRLLNFPDGHWDLTASCHHLEHLGRWDQLSVWREIFRITKPGGRTEHVVPSMDWAAQKIAGGEVDVHVCNVVLGAQEQHGYEREFNTHYFFYTKEIGRGLAEAAGFVDIQITDWRDDDSLGYNMVLRATRPNQEKEVDQPQNTLDRSGEGSSSEELHGERCQSSLCSASEPLATDNQAPSETNGVVPVLAGI